MMEQMKSVMRRMDRRPITFKRAAFFPQTEVPPTSDPSRSLAMRKFPPFYFNLLKLKTLNIWDYVSTADWTRESIYSAKTTWNPIGQNVLAARQQIATVDRK